MCRERPASVEQKSSTDFFFFFNVFFPTYPTDWYTYKFLAPKQTFQEKKKKKIPAPLLIAPNSKPGFGEG